MARLILNLAIAIAIIRRDEGEPTAEELGSGERLGKAELGSAFRAAHQSPHALNVLQLLVSNDSSTMSVDLHEFLMASSLGDDVLRVLRNLCVPPVNQQQTVPGCVRPSIEAVGMCLVSLCQNRASSHHPESLRSLTGLFTQSLISLRSRDPQESTDNWILSCRSKVVTSLGPIGSDSSNDCLGEVMCHW